MIDAHSRVYCILGKPVRHSMSPSIHNPSFEKAGVNAVYVAFEVDDAPAAARALRALGISGASVTIPHKVSVMSELDEIDPVAKMIGAVNTIVHEDGKLYGLNTDGPGAVKALRDAGVDPAGAKVAMIGSGGAARAVGFTLAANEKIAGITILGVVKDELDKLVSEISSKTDSEATAIMSEEDGAGAKKAVEGADIVINASPLGMNPDEDRTPIPAEWISPGAAVFDVVYNPLETLFLKQAAARGCVTVRGVEMFINQAVLQFERWTGRPAPEELMRSIVLERLGSK